MVWEIVSGSVGMAELRIGWGVYGSCKEWGVGTESLRIVHSRGGPVLFDESCTQGI